MPNAFEGQLRISNYEWDAKLRDAQSDVFTSLASTLEEDLRVLLSPLSGKKDDLAVRVTSFSEGSVIVFYSFAWDLSDRDSSLTTANIRNTIANQLKNENGMLFGKFAVDKQSIDVGYTMDKCLTMECSGSCSFAYSQNSFVCSSLTSTDRPSTTTSTTTSSTTTLSTTATTSSTTTAAIEDNKDMLLPQLEANPEPKSEPEPESEPERETEPEPKNEPSKSSNGDDEEATAEPEAEPTPQTKPDIDVSLVAQPETTPMADMEAEVTTITNEDNDLEAVLTIVTGEPFTLETTTEEADPSLITLVQPVVVEEDDEATVQPSEAAEEVSETMVVVTELPPDLTTEAAVGDAATELEEDQITTTDLPTHSLASLPESGQIETLEKATKPENLPDAENPEPTGNTFTTTVTTPEIEITTESVVNIPQDVSGEKIVDDDAAAVSTESTMDTATETISLENIATEKSDVIEGSGFESKLLELVTGGTLDLGQVSTTLTPPKEQPVTFFPSEEVTTDNVIFESETSSSELLSSEDLVIASNEILDAADPKADESDTSDSEAESVTELVTVESETKKSSRREGGRSQALQAADDSENQIKFIDVKSTNVENSIQDETTTIRPASSTDKLSNNRIIFPDDADDQPFEITFSTQLPSVETTSVIEASNTSTLSAENDPIDGCISGLATHQVCDSLIDCENGEDEAECGFPSCQEDEFSCLKGRCIPAAWKCDGKPDCSEGEDEVI